MKGVNLPEHIVGQVVSRRGTAHPIANLDPARTFDIVLITGTVTNMCCESSARDAMIALYSSFTDLMDTDMIVTALQTHEAQAA